MKPLLEVKNLRVEFPTRHGTLLALDDISFTIAPGEILGVVGESGAGKSLTGAAIIGLLEPPGRIAAGQVLLDGRRIDELDADAMRKVRGKQIGAVFQDPLTSLNPLYTVGRQLVETIQTHLPLNAAQARERAIDLLRQTGIPAPEARIDQYPHQFSGGMRQRVVAAMAIACAPRLLIADEPTSNLDVTIQVQMIALLRELQQETGLGIILITHDLGVAAAICRRIAVMYAGRIVETGDVRQIFRAPAHPYTQALLRSIPHLGRRRARLDAIAGQPPSLIDPPVGCRFAARCERRDVRCASDYPPDRELAPGHVVACWHPGPPGRAEASA